MSTTATKIANYIKLRDHKKEADEEFKKSMERVNAAMLKLENQLLEEMENSGTDSIKAKGIGTAYIRTVTNLSTKDTDALFKWAVKSRELGALDIRGNKTVIGELFDKGTVVPGVELTKTRLLGIRAGK